MAKTVIVTKKTLEVNKVYQGLDTGPWNEPRPEQYFRVIAPADAQDWIDGLVAIQGEGEREWLDMLIHINGPWNYYEIQTD